MLYDKLTKEEIEYMAQDDIFKQDINNSDVLDIFDYLTPMYKRYTSGWYELINRLFSD